jgi:hypothetical protein
VFLASHLRQVIQIRREQREALLAPQASSDVLQRVSGAEDVDPLSINENVDVASRRAIFTGRPGPLRSF